MCLLTQLRVQVESAQFRTSTQWKNKKSPFWDEGFELYVSQQRLDTIGSQFVDSLAHLLTWCSRASTQSVASNRPRTRPWS